MVLTFAGFLSDFVGRKSAKPKYVASYPGQPADPAQTSGLATIGFCYARASHHFVVATLSYGFPVTVAELASAPLVFAVGAHWIASGQLG